jgi:hypothetical protein
MAESSSKTDKAFDDWRKAEVKYADLLASVMGDGQPGKVKKDTAVDLAKLRSRADAARHGYFKRALK